MVCDVRACQTAKSIVQKNSALSRVLQDSDIEQKLLAQGSEGVGGTPEQLGTRVKEGLVKGAKLPKDAQVKVD